MATILAENNKPLRKSLDVLLTLEDKRESIGVGDVSVTNTYTGLDIADDFYDYMKPFQPMMDLAGDGFLSDGSAIPVPDDPVEFAIGKVNTSMTITVETESAGQSVAVFYYDSYGELHKLVSTSPITIPAMRYVRAYIAWIVIGDAYVWDNSSMISCDLSLRGVGTNVDNPELSVSEIQFKVTVDETEDWEDIVATIGENKPITYRAGYPGDMSPERKFYLTDQIEFDRNVITVKGQDATKFIEGESIGYVIGSLVDGDGGGVKAYFDFLQTFLIGMGITPYVPYNPFAEPFVEGENFFIPNISKRKVIAQAINLMHFHEYWSQEDINFVYVDAGRPTLKRTYTDLREDFTIEPAEITKIIERKIKRIEIMNPYVDRGPSETVTTLQDHQGTTIETLDKPYATLSSSNGGLTRIGNYAYRQKGTGNITITGRPIRMYDPNDDESHSPYFIQTNGNGTTVVLDDFIGMQEGLHDNDGYYNFWHDVFVKLLARSNIKYDFIWRGNPKMQPWDVIRVDVDGTETDMTVESLTLEHSEGGGFTSHIVARKGMI